MTQRSHLIPIGQVISQLNYFSLMSKLHLLVNQTGVATVETEHFRWEIFIYGGSVAFVADQGSLGNTLQRKLRVKKVYVRPDVWQGFHLKSLHGIDICNLLGKLYECDRDSCLKIFKEILLENLLAIALEKNCSLVWQPVDWDLKAILPIWQLTDLESAIAKIVHQWQIFQYVHHPYQTVQLVNTNCNIAQVALFAQLTNGKYQINEIADYFEQNISRTALNLDKLAQNHTVHILPLAKRSTQLIQSVQQESALQVSNQVSNELDISQNVDHAKSLPKIMVVDDSPVLLKQFGDLLASWGYQLTLVINSAQAMQKMLDDRPDLVFMDINMPDMNGFELLKQIRRQPSLANIPLILVTSENSVTNSFRAKWANCRFIGKPQSTNDIKEFREQVRAILQEFTPL
jgi:CheY-like chemotaxis protein